MSALTDLVLDRILQCVRGGVFPERAAAFAGIPLDTFRGWVDRGQKSRRGKYRRLYDAIQQAEAICEQDLTVELYRASAESPSACLAFIERRFAERWGRRRLVAQDATEGGAIPRFVMYLPLEEEDPTAITKPLPESIRKGIAAAKAHWPKAGAKKG